MILLILDGLTDAPSKALGGKTPYEAADCPYLRQMKRDGAYGAFLTAPQGFSVDSLTCIATLLGVPPNKLPAGRAYMEALSAGVSVEQDDAVCRCNLVSVDSNGILQSSCATGLSAIQMKEYCQQAAEQNFRLHPMCGYKNLLVLGGGAQQLMGIHTYPPHEHLGKPVDSLLPTGNQFAQSLREFAWQTRRKDTHTECTQMLLPWDVAVRQELPEFSSLHGISAAAVCATEIVRGIALAMGLPVETPQGATADADTDLGAKAQAALSLLERHDLVLVHINGTDELSHRRDAQGKAEFLSRIDAQLIAPLLTHAPQNTAFLVCSDHSTLSSTGQHHGDPQPFILYSNTGAMHANLGTYNGLEAISLLKGLIYYGKGNHGTRDDFKRGQKPADSGTLPHF